jgi:hypothetical protein
VYIPCRSEFATRYSPKLLNICLVESLLIFRIILLPLLIDIIFTGVGVSQSRVDRQHFSFSGYLACLLKDGEV